MCQYLFAAYSLKRYPYECWDGPQKELLTQAQLEAVRRWAMKITLIARQEMEHLGLALNLISAIGGSPSFSRPNFPQRRDYYGDVCIKLELTACTLDTIKRFQAFEVADDLSGQPCEDVSQKKAESYCNQRRENGASPQELFDAFMKRNRDEVQGLRTPFRSETCRTSIKPSPTSGSRRSASGRWCEIRCCICSPMCRTPQK